MLTLQQAARENNTICRFGDLQILLSRRKIWFKGLEVFLSKREFQILEVLISNRGKCLQRDQIRKEVWSEKVETTERTVDTYIKRLRQKIDPLGEYIQSIHGAGYIFKT